jgi:hypothetical protein
MALLKQQLPGLTEPRGPEHRKHHRTRALKGAKIVFNGGSSVIDCTMRNTSSSGACLELVSLAGLPNEFGLRVASDPTQRHCRVAWKRANRVGVQFIG